MTLLVEDRELLARFRDGDPDALTRVYRHFAPEVARFLRAGFGYSRSGAPAVFLGISSAFDLENAVQEVFARAFTERARLAYDGLRPYRSYLFGIARNHALDTLRRRARRPERIEAPEDLERVAEDSRPAEHTADERRGRALVNEFLAEHCDDMERRLYTLRYADETSQQETADALGLTRIQVRRRETKLKRRLLRFLKRADYVREP